MFGGSYEKIYLPDARAGYGAFPNCANGKPDCSHLLPRFDHIPSEFDQYINKIKTTVAKNDFCGGGFAIIDYVDIVKTKRSVMSDFR